VDSAVMRYTTAASAWRAGSSAAPVVQMTTVPAVPTSAKHWKTPFPTGNPDCSVSA